MNRWGLFPQHFGPESELFRHLFHGWLGVSFVSLNGQIRQENHTKPLSPARFLFFDYCSFFFIGIPSGNLCGVERHKTQSHGHILIKGICAVFIKYALIIPRACLGRTAARSPAKSSYMCCLRLGLKGVASEGKGVIYTGFSRSLSDGYAMLMSPSKGETAVHGCYCPRDLAVRTREVMARPWGGVCVLLAEIYL